MLVDITGSCGHIMEKNLTNASGQEPGPRSLKKSMAYWEAKVCTGCYVTTKNTETANSLVSFGTLPDLTGSERQVSWANRIRAYQLAKLGEYMKDGNGGTHEEYRAKTALLTTITDAKFWIDTRDEYENVLMGTHASHLIARNLLVKIDLEAGKVILSERSIRKEVTISGGRTIMVGGKKFYDREVN